MDKVLNKSRSMLFRKWKGKDDVESVFDSQRGEAGRGMRTVSGPLDHLIAPDSTRGIAKSAISSPIGTEINHQSLMSTPGYSQSAHLRPVGNSAQPVSDTREIPSTIRYRDYGPHPRTRHMVQRNVPDSHSSSPVSALASAQQRENSARVHGRSQSVMTSGENSSAPSASTRSRRHGMHLHSLGNVVTMIESGPRATENANPSVFPREPGEFSQSFIGRSTSAPISNHLRDTDKGLSKRTPSNPALVNPCLTKEGEKTQFNTPTLNPSNCISPTTIQSASPHRDDSKRFLSNSSLSKPPSSFPHDRLNSTYSTHNTLSRMATSNDQQCERSSSRSEENPQIITFLNSSTLSPDQQFKTNGPRAQISKPLVYDQQQSISCVNKQDSQVRGWGQDDNQHSKISSTAKDRLLREINKMHRNTDDGGCQDPKALDRTGNTSRLNEHTIDSKQPVSRSMRKESITLNSKEILSQLNTLPPSDSEHLFNSHKPVQARRESMTRSPNSQDTVPSSASLTTPPPFSTTLSFLANQLDMADALPLHSIGASAMQHDVVSCLCRECNYRISQLEREVKGLRWLLLEIIKSPGKPTRDSLAQSLYSSHPDLVPNASDVEEPIQFKNTRTDTPSSYAASLGDPSLRLVSYFEDDDEDPKQNTRPLKLMRRKGTRSKANESDSRRPRGLW